jgi:uncharacterized membrane protein
MFFGKKIKIVGFLPTVIVALSFVLAFYFYPQMPDRLASHWNAQGDVDGYMGKATALFLMPVLSLIFLVVFLTVPKMDPMKENIEKIGKHFGRFINLIFIFLFYVYALTLAWNLGYRFDMIKFLMPAFAIVIYAAGVLTENAEPNWTVGIRTPWTLSNPEVWKKTHRLGGKLFKICALLSLIGIFSEAGFWIFVGGLLFSSMFLFVYSYVIFRKLKK